MDNASWLTGACNDLVNNENDNSDKEQVGDDDDGGYGDEDNGDDDDDNGDDNIITINKRGKTHKVYH